MNIPCPDKTLVHISILEQHTKFWFIYNFTIPHCLFTSSEGRQRSHSIPATNDPSFLIFESFLFFTISSNSIIGSSYFKSTFSLTPSIFPICLNSLIPASIRDIIVLAWALVFLFIHCRISSHSYTLKSRRPLQKNSHLVAHKKCHKRLNKCH